MQASRPASAEDSTPHSNAGDRAADMQDSRGGEGVWQMVGPRSSRRTNSSNARVFRRTGSGDSRYLRRLVSQAPAR